jgi:sigma-B regulation protein RsbU (phosphoserine phosphatase)
MARVIDISASRRIGVLTRLVEDMGRLSDPLEAFDAFYRGMREAFNPMNAAQLSTLGLGPGEFRVFGLRAAGVERVVNPSPWDYRTLPIQSRGAFAEIVRAGVPCIVEDLDLSDDPALGAVFGACRSLAATPILVPDLPVNWVVMLDEDPCGYKIEHLEELIVRTNLAGALVRGLRATQQLAAANLRISREIEQIARIQRTLLPSQLPEIPGLEIAAHYETFDQAGGDLYDFARMEGDPTTDADDRWAILIADASGHGPAAATVCAIVHSILHAYPQEPSGPAELLGHVNRHLCAKQIESSFVTAFLAFYQASTRELVYARAGHNPPLLVSTRAASDAGTGGGSRSVLAALKDAVGLPLGIDSDATFNEERLTLAPGQAVVLYTDGITEAKNAAGDLFGVEGIEAALADCGEGARSLVHCLTEAVRKHQGARSAGDDQTILVLEATPMADNPRRRATTVR